MDSIVLRFGLDLVAAIEQNRRRSLMLLLLLVIVMLPTTAAGGVPIVLEDGMILPPEPLGLHTEVLHDAGRKYTIDDVTGPELSGKFEPSRAATLNFGFSEGAYWLRLPIRNNLKHEKTLLLEAAFPLIDSVDLYIPNGTGGYDIRRGGELVGGNRGQPRHRNPVFAITLPPERQQTYYLRFQYNGSVPLPLILWEPDAFLKHTTRQYLLFGLYYGCLLAIILYNTVIFLTVRIRSYLYYVIFATFYLIWQLVYNGLANQFLWPQAPWFTNRIMPFLICVTGMSGLQFARSFLGTKENVPVAHTLFSLLMAGFAAIMVLSVNPRFSGSIPLAALACILFAFGALFTCGYCWKKGVRPARYFSIAWCGLLVGTVLLGLKSFGVLPSNFITEYGQQFGSVLEMALFSLALADRLRSLRQEKEEARAEILRTQQQANRQLEEKVHQRTRDLAEKNQQLQLLAAKLSKYLSPQVYTAIFSGQAEVKLCSYRKKLTIFFSDIEGFTELTDRMEPEPLAAILNEYLDEMAAIALQYGGTIDKYIGDAIMIFFGDPETRGDKEDALAAVLMALAMRHRMRRLQQKWQEQILPYPLRVRMGVNTGYCTVGNFGSEDRLDYTLIGGQVNLASRLQSHARPDEIFISYQTYVLIKDVVACEEKGELRVKGIAYPVRTYQVIDRHDMLR
jgi:class 3 adenylate cyclase